jgi:hypothetical protein
MSFPIWPQIGVRNAGFNAGARGKVPVLPSAKLAFIWLCSNVGAGQGWTIVRNVRGS